ncbi:vWA domain-containing protein [Pseudarthrobacter phenanthrenivorans]|uniref:vWA domain-containing protein n=1 Tax=Pseudarthrobacter phenanthrenivorans TaxID=361575 RepID=UPI001FEC32D6|nr:VWA domain-containing protein [Pseudarthrobacter phenanthrenivorans]
MTLQPILPWWLLLPVLVAALVLTGWRLYRGLRAGAGRIPGRGMHPGVRPWLRRTALVLLLAGAAVRPGLPGGEAQAVTTDLNVFLVVDTTTSMVAEDYGDGLPRMEGVRRDIAAIAGELPGARFSVITFDTKAHVRMPLTTDTLALDTITSVLEPQVTAYAKGSSITAARQVLSERLEAARESHPERPRLVFYLGDGEQTTGQEPGPMDLDGLVAGGAVLGYGTAAGGKMRENTGRENIGREDGGGPTAGDDRPYVKDSTGEDAVSSMDEAGLERIAGQLGVPYVHRSAGDPVAPVMRDARAGDIDAGSVADGMRELGARTELYWLPAAGAFVLGLAELVQLVRQSAELRPATAHPGNRRRDTKAVVG